MLGFEEGEFCGRLALGQPLGGLGERSKTPEKRRSRTRGTPCQEAGVVGPLWESATSYQGSPPDRALPTESGSRLGLRRSAWALGSMGSAKAVFRPPSPRSLLAAQPPTETGKPAEAQRDADSPETRSTECEGTPSAGRVRESGAGIPLDLESSYAACCGVRSPSSEK